MARGGQRAATYLTYTPYMRGTFTILLSSRYIASHMKYLFQEPIKGRLCPGSGDNVVRSTIRQPPLHYHQSLHSDLGQAPFHTALAPPTATLQQLDPARWTAFLDHLPLILVSKTPSSLPVLSFGGSQDDSVDANDVFANVVSSSATSTTTSTTHQSPSLFFCAQDTASSAHSAISCVQVTKECPH